MKTTFVVIHSTGYETYDILGVTDSFDIAMELTPNRDFLRWSSNTLDGNGELVEWFSIDNYLIYKVPVYP